jgi:hypothetical protein
MFTEFMSRFKERVNKVVRDLEVVELSNEPRRNKCGECGQMGHNSRRHQTSSLSDLKREIDRLEDLLREAEDVARANREEADHWRAQSSECHTQLANLKCRFAMAVHSESTR